MRRARLHDRRRSLQLDAKQHGAPNPQGACRDLGNLSVGTDGTLRTDVVAKALLAAGTASLLKTDGTAIVIHAPAHDEKTDPTGNRRARIACGVVKSS